MEKCIFCKIEFSYYYDVCAMCQHYIIKSCSDFFSKEREPLRCVSIDCSEDWDGRFPFCGACQVECYSYEVLKEFREQWFEGYSKKNYSMMKCALAKFLAFDSTEKARSKRINGVEFKSRD